MMTEHTPTASHDLATLRRAAEIARESDQYEAAIAHYDAALEVLADRHIPPDPLAEYELRSSRAACYHATSEYPPETEDLQAMARLAAELADPRRQVAVVTRQVTLANLLGNAAEGRTAAEAALAWARELDDPGLEADCRCVLGEICHSLSAYEL